MWWMQWNGIGEDVWLFLYISNKSSSVVSNLNLYVQLLIRLLFKTRLKFNLNDRKQFNFNSRFHLNWNNNGLNVIDGDDEWWCCLLSFCWVSFLGFFSFFDTKKLCEKIWSERDKGWMIRTVGTSTVLRRMNQVEYIVVLYIFYVGQYGTVDWKKCSMIIFWLVGILSHTRGVKLNLQTNRSSKVYFIT